jgi:hypothetical protein
MSIFDNTPLPEGTEFYENKILKFCPDTNRYLVQNDRGERWMSRDGVEDRHADFLCRGVSTRYQSPGNAYNTRFFRRNPDKHTNQ